MSASQHHDAESLIALLDRPESLAKDDHASTCVTCAGELDSYRLLAGSLRAEAVWNEDSVREEPIPQTIVTLRAAAEAMRREDEEAEALVSELIARTRREWMPRLLADPKYRTAGVVRRLFAASDATSLRSPGDDLELTRLSTEIADHLDRSLYPSDVVARLRGSAWRDRAYALNYAGDSAQALDAIGIAERQFAAIKVSDYDLGRLELTKALVLRGLDRFVEGLEAVKIARRMFAAADDEGRLRQATSMEAYLCFRAGDPAKALQLWHEVEQALPSNDPTRAGMLLNISVAYRELGDMDSSLDYLGKAADGQASAGETATIVKTRWNIASILVRQGRYKEADRVLTDVIAAFEGLYMREDVILARLDRAEVLIIQQRFEEVIVICHEVVDELRRAHLAHTVRALTAVSYLTEAALARKATPALARQVRDFVRDVRTQPTLLFAPPQ
jgi:tetratricopeptide (TPR) repeat protein